MSSADKPVQPSEVEEIAELTPFKPNELRGRRFARGGMLGGANPLESDADPSWESEESSSTKTG